MSALSFVRSSLLQRCLYQYHEGTYLSCRTFFNFLKPKEKFDPSTLPYSYVTPAKVSPRRTLPEHVPVPLYSTLKDGMPLGGPYYPVIADSVDIEHMKASCKLARKILDLAKEQVKVGITTDEIDEFVHQTCIDNKCYPSPLWYKGFPKSVCTSVNNVLVHGIPDSRPLENGDIICIDVTVYYDGYHGDCAETYAVGDVDEKAQKLIDVARECRDKAIATCIDDEYIRCIGNTIEEIAKSNGFASCPTFTGHGIGPVFHCKPNIWNYANSYPDKMEAGMIFTVEPVILEYEDNIKSFDDGWTITTQRGARSAQFEHTILITGDGCEILTAGEDEPSTVKTQSKEKKEFGWKRKKKYEDGWKYIILSPY